jgi:asparagine synthase (glutamine-hydrolysing)
MCGIAGKVYLNRGEITNKEMTEMAQKIAHRGPDDQGIYISEDKRIGLVNRRLAIIDLTPKGHQPMNFANKYWITFNGEIYNFLSERVILEKEGYRFSSGTDTEVLLALYDKYGIACLKHLRGMFAFAIYDKQKNILFLARDRIGKKPLKYYFDGNTFIFASELKAILTQKEVKKIPDYEAIYHYLTFGYVIPPKTGFIGINKLEPGNYLTLDIKKGKIKKECYWMPNFTPKLDLTEQEWKEKILDELSTATRLRLISDVPIGAFLSGGVDSSAIVALMAKYSPKPIRTFTIGFREKAFDESPYAKKISQIYSTDHTQIIANPESIEILPQLVYQYEEPYADASAIVTYMVSRLAKKYVTVILNGDGGDENFAGYDRYRRIARDTFFDNFRDIITPIAVPITSLMEKALLPRNFWVRSKKFLVKSKLPLSDRFVSYIEYFNNKEKDVLVEDKLKADIAKVDSYQIVRKVFNNLGTIDPADKALFWDLRYYLPEDLLVKVDIASMSVGLEARSPFTDHKVVELACQIPFNLKVKNFRENKYILKKALEGIVPPENLYRKKVGFSIPLHRWFTGKLNLYAKDKLLSKNTKVLSFLKRDRIRQMLDTHTEKSDFGPKLWSILTLELWMRSYF